MAIYMVKSRSELFRVMEVVGIPSRVAGSLINDFFKWLENNGPLWTANRIKELHTLAVQWVGRSFRYRIPDKAGIACHADGTPKGSFRWIFKRIMNIDSPSNRELDRYMSVLKIYSAFTLLVTTRPQLDKFLSAVENPAPDRSGWEWTDMEDYQEVLSPLWFESKYDRLEKWVDTPRRKVLHVVPESGYFGSVSERGLAIDQHRWDAQIMSPGPLSHFSSIYNKALGSHSLPSDGRGIFLSVIDQISLPGKTRWKLQMCAMESMVGKIGILQERGAKARYVANPLRVHQVAVSKLQHFLELCVQRGLPWDCTFDQEKGVRWLQQKLKAGYTLRTTDLSSASDRFPLPIITSLLEAIGPRNNKEFLDTLKLQERLSRGAWYFSSKKMPSKWFVKWTKGIPLGIYSCFLSFAVTHGFVLRKLERLYGLEDSFRVLGDDVIMTTELGQHYEFWLERMGAPTNGLKGLTSQYVGEFASRLASEQRVIRAYKFPKGDRLFHTSEPLDLLKKFGPRAIRLVPKRFRESVIYLASLSKSRGGLGWKPPQEYCSLDPKGLEEIVAPKSAKKIPDVLYVETYRGGKSFVVRDKRLADRLLELEIAYCHPLPHIPLAIRSASDKDAKVLLKSLRSENECDVKPDEAYWRSHDFNWEFEDAVVTKCVRLERKSSVSTEEGNRPSADFQWEILHANSCLEDDYEGFAEHLDRIAELAAEYPPVQPREFVIQEDAPAKLTAKMNLVVRRLLSYVWANAVSSMAKMLLLVKRD